MNGVHIHLLLNHIPVIGILIGLAVFVLGVARRNDSWTRLALGLFVVVAVASLGTMLTGEGAEEAVERLPGFSEAIIEPHEEAAELAAWASYLLGAVALAGFLWVRGRALPRALTVTVLPLALLVTGLMAYAANLGGQIRHTEIRAAEVRTDD
jgi:uncharacterized membrane protein